MRAPIKCPHCEYELNDDDFYESYIDLWALAPNEKDAEINCQSCDKSFIIKGGYIPTYEAFKSWEDVI